MAAHMWKNNLKNVEYDNNKILYKNLHDFFLQWNGAYFLNKPRIFSQKTKDPVCNSFSWNSHSTHQNITN